MKIYDKLKQIENEFNGNEYFEHGVSFCIGFDALDINIPLKKAVKNVLVEYKAICETEEIKLEKISDFKSDICALFLEWHLDVISIDVIEALDKNVKVYKFSEDTKVGCSYGNINSVFRIIECENEYILVELYVVD